MKKLLIVDDSRVSRLMIRSPIHAQHPEWTIFEASSGEEAIEITARDGSPDYCIVDTNMPGMGGAATIEQLLQFYPSIKLVVTSGNIQDPIQQRFSRLAVKVVKKPIKEEAIALILDHFAKDE